MQKTFYTILGIDPGTNLLGYAVLRIHLSNQKAELIQIGSVDLRNKHDDAGKKLGKVHLKIEELIDQYQPQHLAIEAPFFGKNAQSMLKLGRVQGIAIGLASSKDIAVREYAPLTIKQYATGKGNATKKRVSLMMQKIFSLSDASYAFYDESDALAVAFCHFQHLCSPHEIGRGVDPLPAAAKKKSSADKRKLWADFIHKR